MLPLAALRPLGAWGALLVNLLVGVALVAALVDIPLFARNTTTPGDQLGAALVLLRLLVAVPVGAVAGGWLCRTLAPRWVAAGGMALACGAFVVMTTWDERSLDGALSTVVLLAAGFGFGLAIAPVNAVLLAVTGSDVHGSASALAVVARTVGMLAGLSLLTAVALRRFTAEVEAIGTPFELCPETPADCAVYDAATDAAILTQLHTVFAGAAIAAGLGRGGRRAAAAGPEPPTPTLTPDRQGGESDPAPGLPRHGRVETVGPGPLQRFPDERCRTRSATRRRQGSTAMSWLVLIVSGVLEAVWATALGRSEGFSRLGPSVVFGVALALSMAGLAFAMRDLPVGTSYAVWVGIGAVLTVVYAMLTGGEAASVVKLLLLAGIIGCVIGLKIVH